MKVLNLEGKKKKFTNLEIEKKFRELFGVLTLLRMVEMGYFGDLEGGVKKKIEESKKILESMLGDTKETIKRVLEKEEEVQKYQEEFISNINHELRTPLTSILGTTDFLVEMVEKLSREEILERVLRIRRSGKVLLEIVDEVLDFSKIEEGCIMREEEEFNLVEFFGEILEYYRDMCRSKGILLLDEVEDMRVRMSRMDLRRVSNNLLSNAYKFTDRGEISVGVKGFEIGFEKRLRISVKDSGLGIKEEDIPNVFERFWKGSVGGEIKGTGIGLYMVYKIVKGYGGDLRVESAFGYGSEFFVDLPLRKGEGGDYFEVGDWHRKVH